MPSIAKYKVYTTCVYKYFNGIVFLVSIFYYYFIIITPTYSYFQPSLTHFTIHKVCIYDNNTNNVFFVLRKVNLIYIDETIPVVYSFVLLGGNIIIHYLKRSIEHSIAPKIILVKT
jgi:hypothetical protein